MRFSILALSLACAPLPVAAQTAAKPDGQWRGAFGAGLSATTGNNDSLTLTMNGDAVRQTATDKLSGYAQAVYGRRTNAAGGVDRTSDLLRGGVAYNRDLNARTFGYGLADLERNKLTNLNLRTAVSGGVGYHVIKRDGLAFDVSTGPVVTHEVFTTDTRTSLEWLLAEESNHVITPAVSFRQRLALFPNLSHSGEYRVVFDAGLVFKVNSRWSATVTLNDRYQSDPPVPGTARNDLLFVTGLQYVFNP